MSKIASLLQEWSTVLNYFITDKIAYIIATLTYVHFCDQQDYAMHSTHSH